MEFLLGLDPGGAGNFGWCIAAHSDRLPVALASGLSDSAPQAIASALDEIPAGGVLVAAGIDAPLFWSRTGNRAADHRVREALRGTGAPYRSGTVQNLNSLRGACLVQGMLAGLELRERFPTLPITEAHPKALRWLLPEVATITAGSEHERDAMLAVVSAWAVLKQFSDWSDLLAGEPDAYSPIRPPLVYWMPHTPKDGPHGPPSTGESRHHRFTPPPTASHRR